MNLPRDFVSGADIVHFIVCLDSLASTRRAEPLNRGSCQRMG